MTNKEIYDLTKYLVESWERGADYDNYHMDCQYVLDALVMPEEERWLLYNSPPQQQAEPTSFRDMIVVSLVREGINKHKARELADHFKACISHRSRPRHRDET